MSARHGKQRQRGIALIAVMLTLLLVTAIAAGILILANTETNTSANFKDEQQALFAAKAGIEEARDRLRTGQSYTLTLPTGLVGNGTTGVLYILNPMGGETVSPWDSSNAFVDDEICKENFSGGSSLACTTNSTTGKSLPSGTYYTTANADSTFEPTSGAVLAWKWARITLKQSNAFGAGYYVDGNSANTSQVYWNGNSECVSGATCTLPVYVITALGVTKNGSRRMVQMEVARDQLNFTAPSALTMDGSGDTFSGGTSGNWGVSGVDTAVPGCGGGGTGAAVAAIGVSDGHQATGNGNGANAATGDVANVINGIPNNRTGNYTGIGASPDVENISSSSTYAADKLSSYSDLTSLVSTLKNDVTQPVVAGGSSYTGGAALFNSSSSSPQIVYVNGDLTLGGSVTGYGILVVTGTLTVHGNVNWNGVILVVGSGNVQTDGTPTYNGAMVVANTSGGSIGSPTFAVNGGGNAGVNYSSACVAQATQMTTYHSVSYRELIR